MSTEKSTARTKKVNPPHTHERERIDTHDTHEIALERGGERGEGRGVPANPLSADALWVKCDNIAEDQDCANSGDTGQQDTGAMGMHGGMEAWRHGGMEAYIRNKRRRRIEWTAEEE